MITHECKCVYKHNSQPFYGILAMLVWDMSAYNRPTWFKCL